jgi:hypothetical protein
MADQINEDGDLELEIVDDTPEADRNKTPIKASVEPTEEELNTYSADVKKRFSQLTHAIHDQRRIAEAATREREAAETYARAMHTKATQLEQRFASGEKVFVAGMKEKADQGVEAAKARLKAATEEFDADKIVEAQQELTKHMLEQQRYVGWQPQNVAQDEKSVVQQQQNEQPARQAVPKPDARASSWAAKNPWFEVNKAMTGFAYGVDTELREQGVDPATDPVKYYAEIDRRMRDVFPAEFEDSDPPERNARNGTSRTPVAPVRRSASGKRVVTLTKSQEAMARRLGIEPAQYAAEVVKLESLNG